jgi:serine/threonine protein kinase
LVAWEQPATFPRSRGRAAPHRGTAIATTTKDGTRTSRHTIGKYPVMKELGRGATGKVYLCDDPFAKRKVAIKLIYPEALKNTEDGALYKSMFLNEAGLAGKLNHPHIVQIFDAVVEASTATS